MILDVLTRYHHHHHHAHCNVVETSRSLLLVLSESPGCSQRDDYSLSCFMLEDPFSFLITEPQENRVTMNLYILVFPLTTVYSVLELFYCIVQWKILNFICVVGVYIVIQRQFYKTLTGGCSRLGRMADKRAGLCPAMEHYNGLKKVQVGKSSSSIRIISMSVQNFEIERGSVPIKRDFKSDLI